MDTSSDNGCPSMEFTLISSLFSEPSVLARVSTRVCMKVGYCSMAVNSGLRT